MKKAFRNAASLVMASSMLASVIPSAFAAEDIYNHAGLQETIKRHVAEKHDAAVDSIAYTYDENLLGSADIVLNADTDVRVAGSEDDYGDNYISAVGRTTVGASLSGDFKSTLYMEPVRDTFVAFRDSAYEEAVDPTMKLLLPMIPVNGEFEINVIYNNEMEIANREEFLKTGSMYGFNEGASEIFVDTERTDDPDPDHEGYNKFTVKVKVKAPTSTSLQGIAHEGDWENTLVFADLDKFYETLLADIDFTVPLISVSKPAGTPAGQYWYTESISMSGDITIGKSLSTISFNTQQLPDNADNYKDVKDWEKISATMMLQITKPSSGGGGGSNTGASTPVPGTLSPLRTLAPGETPDPNATIDPNATPDPNATIDPNATPGPNGTTTPGNNPVRPNVDPNGNFVPSNHTVPSALNGEDHMVYVIGYPEGDVRPLRSITREEIATIFYRLLTDTKRDSIYTKESPFTDVLKSRWSNKAIATMANGSYILGDAGTTNFRPADPITRAEMAAIVSRFLDTTPDIKDSSDDYNDLYGHWAATAIAQGTAAGWLTGYEDGSYRPDQQITRAEAMTVINRMLVRYVREDGLCEGFVEWPDNPSDEWYYYNVIEATNSHEYDERTFATTDDYYENWPALITNWIWGEFKTNYEDPDEIDKQ